MTQESCESEHNALHCCGRGNIEDRGSPALKQLCSKCSGITEEYQAGPKAAALPHPRLH